MGRTTWFDADGMRKGEWTKEEDKKLVAYINEHGLGEWGSLPKRAGLERCGKSCRLRWLNYLKPGIKRGKFTPLEEEEIIKFHALLGNRWASIAKRMPNRTDNDIKNHWNSCLKKRLSKNGIDPMTHKPKILTDEVTSSSPSSSSVSPSSSTGSAHLLNKLAEVTSSSPSSSSVSPSSSTGSAHLLNKLASEISRKDALDKIKNVILSEQKRKEEEEMIACFMEIDAFDELLPCDDDSAASTTSAGFVAFDDNSLGDLYSLYESGFYDETEELDLFML